METMIDYDEATHTVAMDDGGRESVFDVGICPRCGDIATTVVRAGEWYDDANDHAFCFRCEWHAERVAAPSEAEGA